MALRYVVPSGAKGTRSNYKADNITYLTKPNYRNRKSRSRLLGLVQSESDAGMGYSLT